MGRRTSASRAPAPGQLDQAQPDPVLTAPVADSYASGYRDGQAAALAQGAPASRARGAPDQHPYPTRPERLVEERRRTCVQNLER